MNLSVSPPSEAPVTNGTAAVPPQPEAAAIPSGDRFTPAPVVFSPTSLAQYSGLATKQGPASAAELTAAAPPGACKTIGEVLSAVPEASKFLQLLKVGACLKHVYQVQRILALTYSNIH